jgi:chaperonin cofactor prefoldin
MLKGIQKLMNNKHEGDVEMSAAELATELSTTKATLESQVALFSELSGKYASLEAAFTELTSNFESAQTALAAVEAEKKELATKAEEARLVARKEKIVAAVGTSQADALMAAVGGLEDAQFNAVVSAMATSREAEANTEAFQEVGVSGHADASKVAVEKSALEAKLEEKYRASQHSN